MKSSIKPSVAFVKDFQLCPFNAKERLKPTGTALTMRYSLLNAVENQGIMFLTLP